MVTGLGHRNAIEERAVGLWRRVLEDVDRVGNVDVVDACPCDRIEVVVATVRMRLVPPPRVERAAA